MLTRIIICIVCDMNVIIKRKKKTASCSSIDHQKKKKVFGIWVSINSGFVFSPVVMSRRGLKVAQLAIR